MQDRDLLGRDWRDRRRVHLRKVGAGYLVLSANNYFNTPMAFAALLYLVLMSLALYGMVILAEKFMLPWYRREAAG
jgi:ABC-type nitrate/sulfonate/bicarbonate transport system permease component